MSATRILVVEDMPERISAFENRFGNKIKVVCFVNQAIEELNNTVFDIAFLDHDLGDYQFDPYPHELTGSDVALHIAELPPERRPKNIVIHSHNIVGRSRMCNILERVNLDPVLAPFPECLKIVC